MACFRALLALAACGAARAGATSISFQNGVNSYTGTGDTTIGPGTPDTNYGTSAELDIYDQGPTNLFQDLIRFDLTSVASGTIVTGATLTLTQVASYDAQSVINSLYVVAAADKSWTESSATWDNLDQSVPTPWAGATPGLKSPNDYDATNPVATAASPYVGVVGYDVRPSGPGLTMTFTLNASGIAAIQDWINTPGDNSGFFMRQPDVSNSIDVFASSNSSVVSLRPLLTLDVIVVPEPASCVLFGLATVGLLLAARRRRRA